MSRPIEKKPSFPARLLDQLGPAAFMFAATLLALPVNAGITLPTDPLTTASRVPPNILFILDDSGSMTNNYMPDNVPDTTAPNVSDQAYTRNTVYYNPATTYQPWTLPSGSLMTGGTSYTSVYSDPNYVTYSGAGPLGQGTIATTSGTRDLSATTQTFYVPKDPANTSSAYLGDGRNYYRYQIIDGASVERSEYGTVSSSGPLVPAGFPKTGQSGSNGRWSAIWTVTVPDDTTTLAFATSGGNFNRNGADLYVRHGSAPTTNNYDQRSNNQGNNETISINAPAAGTWYVGIYANTQGNNGSSYSGVTLTASYSTSNRCGSGTGGSDWINCSQATPTGRSVADELRNYATWYSYHRTRMKVAKAGASAAFSEIGGDMRVGFRTIWQRNLDVTSDNMPTFATPIPVQYNDGLFLDRGTSNNRTQWYNRLFSVYGNGATPLHGALKTAGDYFSSTGTNGPYGPSTGVDQLACRQNFTILTSDGYWNGKDNYPNPVNEQDNVAGDTITGPGGASYQYTPTNPYRSADTDTLADVAMRYWKNDLRTDLDNIVPTTNSDPAFWQHMVTFGISIGEKGTLNPKTDLPALTAGTLSWPTPVNNTIVNVDDLWHATVNGHGDFIVASNPTEFASGLKAALSAITERVGSFSNVAANSASLNSGAKLFQANYVSGVWTGEVLAYAKSATSNSFNTTASWRASLGIPATGRKVYTSNAGVGTNFPTSAQVTALDRNGTTDQYKVTGANNAAYIAGDRSLEIQNNGILRNRNHLLGDIVSSSPFYVQDTDTLYVGANDGMLHAINAADGAELFAYVPSGINLGDLSTISRPDYAHRYFVDGPVVVSSRTQTPGENILVGTLGKGGKGLFALNVTNPSTVTAEGALRWEHLDTPNGNMGLVQSKPLIARLNGGITGLVVPNGINSTTGHAALLIYDLSTGELIREIDTGVGSPATDDANSNGLTGAVGWDRDGNGTVDAIYGGDMLGNLWKFDISSSTSGSWAIANSGSPLFVAVGPDGATRQPITGGPTLALHPSTYKTWVFFGTGRYMTTGDATNNATQSLYGFIDQGATVAKSDLTARKVLIAGTSGGRPVRSFEPNTALPSASKGWYINLLAPPVPPGTAAGERIISPPQIDGSVLEVSSIIPTADACQSDGRGYLNAVDAFTGTSTSKPYFDVNRNSNFSDDTLPNPTGGGTTPIGSVDLGVGMVTQASLFSGGGGIGQACAAGSAGSVGCVGKDEVRNVGRVSWREIIRN
jgi:type IV pilus assembly protein PilY1